MPFVQKQMIVEISRSILSLFVIVVVFPTFFDIISPFECLVCSYIQKVWTSFVVFNYFCCRKKWFIEFVLHFIRKIKLKPPKYLKCWITFGDPSWVFEEKGMEKNVMENFRISIREIIKVVISVGYCHTIWLNLFQNCQVSDKRPSHEVNDNPDFLKIILGL